MDQSSFDRIARLLGGAASRRAGVRAALGGLLGLPAAIAGPAADPAGAAGMGGKGGKGRKKRNRGNGGDNDRRRTPKPEGPCGDRSRKDNLCTKNTQCCTGYCKKGLKNKDGLGRCRCIKKNKPCNPSQTCCGKLSCSGGRCRGGVPTGQPCAASDTCEDAQATCTTYRLGSPAGTWCLLPDAAACGDDDAFCASSFCSRGTCASCTVCAANCPYTTISAAYAAAPAGAEIGIAPGSYDESIEGIDQDVTFRRCGRSGVVAWTSTVDSTTLLSLDSSEADITIRDIEFSSSTTYGLVWVKGVSGSLVPTLTASNCRFHDSTCSEYQAPVTIGGGAIGTFTNCSFENNQGDSYGGAIQVYNGGAITVASCTFTGNASRPEANYHGGAIASNRDTGDTTPSALAILNSTFTGNHADSYGGAISADTYTDVTITGCAFTNNTAKGGGAVNLGSNVAAISNSTFTGNQAEDSGGAVVTSGYPGMTTTITGCTFTGNSAGNSDGDSYSGGGALLLAYSGTITLQDCTITGNTSKTQGGGILASASDGNQTLILSGNTVVSGNSVTDGGAGAGSGLAAFYKTGLGGSVSITGASTRVSGNTTPPTNCATNSAGSYSDVPGCASF